MAPVADICREDDYTDCREYRLRARSFFLYLQNNMTYQYSDDSCGIFSNNIEIREIVGRSEKESRWDFLYRFVVG